MPIRFLSHAHQPPPPIPHPKLHHLPILAPFHSSIFRMHRPSQAQSPTVASAVADRRKRSRLSASKELAHPPPARRSRRSCTAASLPRPDAASLFEVARSSAVLVLDLYFTISVQLCDKNIVWVATLVVLACMLMSCVGLPKGASDGMSYWSIDLQTG